MRFQNFSLSNRAVLSVRRDRNDKLADMEPNMKRPTSSFRTSRVLYCFATVTIIAVSSAYAQLAIAPTTKSYFSATPIPFEQARLAAQSAQTPTGIHAF